MAFTVYILRTSRNTFYTGQTNNLEKRLKLHKEKSPKSAKYLRLFRSFELVYKEEFGTRGDALRREIEIKKLTHKMKEELISQAGESVKYRE